jgi:hypothetical protein
MQIFPPTSKTQLIFITPAHVEEGETHTVPLLSCDQIERLKETPTNQLRNFSLMSYRISLGKMEK